MVDEPFSPDDAKALARTILDSGEIRFLGHYEDRAGWRGITRAECVEAVLTGTVVDVQFRKGTWRYRFESATTAVAVLFENEKTMWFVTTYDPGNPETGERNKG